MAAPNNSNFYFRRLVVFGLFGVLCLVGPIGVICLSIAVFLWEKPLGEPSKIWKLYEDGSVKDGELWFPTCEWSGNIFRHDHRYGIRRLNLETGIEQDSGMIIPSDIDLEVLTWVGDHLFSFNDVNFPSKRIDFIEISRSVPRQNESDHDLSTWHRRSNLFEFEGQATFIGESEAEAFRLLHWTGERWIDGREIQLPGRNRIWKRDHEQNRDVLQSPTSNPASAAI